jgi:hypothetical protein
MAMDAKSKLQAYLIRSVLSRFYVIKDFISNALLDQLLQALGKLLRNLRGRRLDLIKVDILSQEAVLWPGLCSHLYTARKDAP